METSAKSFSFCGLLIGLPAAGVRSLPAVGTTVGFYLLDLHSDRA
jgi:hypothetical protein